MALGTTEERDLLGSTARQALEKAFPEGYAGRLLQGDDVVAPWAELARLGWFGIGIGEDAGGAGGDFSDQAVILHEMGRVLAPAAYAATACGAAPVIAALGSTEQKARWLGPLLGGERAGLLVSGPDSGRMRAEPDGDRLVISGETAPMPGAAVAETLAVEATRDDGAPVAAVVAREAPGVTITPVRGLDATAQLARVKFDNVQVEPADVLGPNPGGPVGDAVDRLTAAALAELAGAGERMQEMAVEYAKVREQFGKPIGTFQAIKHMCADMVVRLEASKAAVGFAVLSLAEGREDASTAVSAAKAFAPEAIGLLAEDALQVHGGIGFTWEHPIHLYVRRAASVARLYGSADMHRERVAKAVGL